MNRRARPAVFLLGVAGTWNAGNIGPIATRLAEELSVSLPSIGLLAGTFFFGGIVAAGLAGSELSRRILIAAGLRAACLSCFAGNVLCALSPGFGLLVAGRVVAGVGAGLIFLYGGGFARAVGGVRLLGVFGAGITLGIAGALGVGGLLEDAGVDWRVVFWISAALALIPLPLLPARIPSGAPRNEPSGGLFRAALTSLGFWRLTLLGISALGVPFVIGAWLVSYLIADDGMSTGLAGLISFALFALSAAMRYVGGRLSAAGASPTLIAAGGSALGAAGIAVLAIDNSIGWALLGVSLIGIGLSLPAALVYDEGEDVLVGRPLGGLGLIQVGANVFPIPLIPLVGAALADGNGEAAFLGLAAFVVLAGLANVRPAARSG